LRVNGTAHISVAPELLDRCAMEGKRPTCVIVIHTESVYFQCARAMARSKLWDPATQVDRATLPTPGAILSELTARAFDGETYDRELPARQRATLY
jgi:hypothetical protein